MGGFTDFTSAALPEYFADPGGNFVGGDWLDLAVFDLFAAPANLCFPSDFGFRINGVKVLG